MTMLESFVRPNAPRAVDPIPREWYPPESVLPEEVLLRWGGPGTFSEFEEEVARTSGGGFQTHDPAGPPKPETYTFSEESRGEVMDIQTFSSDIGVITVKFPRPKWIIFSGPTRTRGGSEPDPSTVILPGVGGPSADSFETPTRAKKQLYMFRFTTPDPFTGLVYRLESNEDLQ